MRCIKKLLFSIPVAASLYSAHHDYVTFPGFINVKANEQCLQLEQVQVLFRHGARSSIKSKECFDDFSNIDAVVWDKEKFGIVPSSIGFDYVVKSVDETQVLEPHNPKLIHLGGCVGGDLTTVGFQEAQDFGKWLANEYIVKHGIIPSVYTSKDVYIRSTLSRRACLTGVGVISGLYGQKNFTETVLIHSAHNSVENICPNWSGCKNITKRFLHHWDDIKVGQEEINKEMGLREGGRPFNYIELNDIVSQRPHHGLHVPEYLLNNKEEISKGAMKLLFDILGTNVDELKNSIGSFVETVCSNIEEAIAGRCESKIIMYPSHDTTVACFLVVLGIFENNWPPFVANIIVELYRGDNNERFIRVLHNRVPVILDKESGEEFLPVDKFMKLVENYRVKDWAENCGHNIK